MTTPTATATAAKVCFSPFIMLRKNLKDDIDVIAMADRLELDEFSIVGRLSDIWDWVDSNSTDGTGLTASEGWIDRRVQCKGFAAAMRSVGWLEGETGALIFPKWDRHNSMTAKARSLEREAKRLRRADCPTTVGQSPDEMSDKRQRQRQRQSESKNKSESQTENKNPSPSSPEPAVDPEPPTSKEEGELSKTKDTPGQLQECRASRPASAESLQPTPEPPEHTWQTLTAALTLAGLNLAAEAVHFAKRNAATPEHCHAVLDHWKANPHAWDVGAIYKRFQSPALCNLPPADGWPKRATPPPVLISDNANEQQREQFAAMDADKDRANASRDELDRLSDTYGTELDALPPEDLISYIPAGPSRAILIKHGWRAPAIRGRILRTHANSRQELNEESIPERRGTKAGNLRSPVNQA